jgi:hypothetical protein
MIYGICHPYAIANTLLDLSERGMNLQELQNTMFIAQAVWLANPLNEYRALFSESFLADQYGPQLYSLHSEFRDPAAVIHNRAHYAVTETSHKITFTNPQLGDSVRDHFIREYLRGLIATDWQSWIDHPNSAYSIARSRGVSEIDDDELGAWGKRIAKWQHPLAFA